MTFKSWQLSQKLQKEYTLDKPFVGKWQNLFEIALQSVSTDK